MPSQVWILIRPASSKFHFNQAGQPHFPLILVTFLETAYSSSARATMFSVAILHLTAVVVASIVTVVIVIIVIVFVVVVAAAIIVFDRGNQVHRKYGRAETGDLGCLIKGYRYVYLGGDNSVNFVD